MLFSIFPFSWGDRTWQAQGTVLKIRKKSRRASLKRITLPQRSVPGGDVLVEIDLHKGADGVIAVTGKAMPVPGQNQEQVQEDLLSIQRGQKTVGQKSARILAFAVLPSWRADIPASCSTGDSSAADREENTRRNDNTTPLPSFHRHQSGWLWYMPGIKRMIWNGKNDMLLRNLKE